MLAQKPKDPSQRLVLVTFLLAFLGGYADALSYLWTEVFAGHLTGNLVLLMIHLAQSAWRASAADALAVGAFLLGTAGAEWLTADSPPTARARLLSVPLLVEASWLLVMACLRRAGPSGNAASLIFLCLGLGWQNGALRKCGAASIHTTFMTGVGTTLLSAMMPRGGRNEVYENPSKHPLTVLSGTLLAFAAGAGTGGWCHTFHAAWELPGLFVPLAAALMVAFSDGDTPTQRSA
jgi:uncharacterized membrane protein YoaK (UPF0700 family)